MPDSNFKTVRVPSAPGTGDRGDPPAELDPKFRAAVIEFFNNQRKFFPATLGLRLVDVKRGYAKMEVVNEERLCQPAMVMHGGASFGMADTAVAYALMGIYGPGFVLLTIEMKINYLERIPLGPVVAEAYVLRASRSSAYAEVDIWADGKLAARASTTYMIRSMPGASTGPAQLKP